MQLGQQIVGKGVPRPRYLGAYTVGTANLVLSMLPDHSDSR